MNDLVNRFVMLEKKKTEIKEYFKELKEVTEALAKELGIGGHFQDNDGIIYQIVVPEGKFVVFDKVSYLRTKREGEKRGDLSMVKARELGYDV